MDAGYSDSRRSMDRRADGAKTAGRRDVQEQDQQPEHQKLLHHFRCCHCGTLPCSGPVLLACLHICCSSCFDEARSDAPDADAIAARESGRIRCPACDELTTAAAPEPDFAAPTENAFVAATLAASAAQDSKPQPLVCAICSDASCENPQTLLQQQKQPLLPPAVRWCEQCAKAMCCECTAWHDKFHPRHHATVVPAAAEDEVTGLEQPRASLLQHRVRLLACYRRHPPPCRQHAAGRSSGGGDRRHDAAESFCGTCKSLLCQACSQQCRRGGHDVEELAGSRLAAEYGRQFGQHVANASSVLSTRCARLRHLLPGELEGARARDIEVLAGRRQAVVEAADRAFAEATRCLDEAYRRAAAVAERLTRDVAAIQARSGQAMAYASALLDAAGLAAVGQSIDDVGIGVQYLIDQQDAVLQRLQVLNADAGLQPVLAEAGDLSLLDVQDVNDVMDPELVRRWIGTVDSSRGSDLGRLCSTKTMDKHPSSEHASSRNHGTTELQAPLSGDRPDKGHTEDVSAGGPTTVTPGTPVPLYQDQVSDHSEQQSELQEKQRQQLLLQQQLPSLQQQQTQQQQQQQEQQQTQQQQQQQTQQPQQQTPQQQPQQQQQQQADHLQTVEIHNSIELSEESSTIKQSQDRRPAKSTEFQQADRAAAAAIDANRSDLTLLPSQQLPVAQAAFDFRGREMDALCLQPAATSLSVPSDSRSVACTVDGRLFVAALRKGLKQYDLMNGGKKMKSWHPPHADDGNPGCVNVVCTLDDSDCTRLAVADIHGERVMLLRRKMKHPSSADGRTMGKQTGFAARPAANSDSTDSGRDDSGGNSESESGDESAVESALVVELNVQLHFGPWGLTARCDLVALSSAEVVKKPVREHNARNSSFAVMSSKCSPGRRLLLYSQSRLGDGVTLFERDLEYDIACIALTGNGSGCSSTAVLCASVFQATSYAADLNLCFVDAYSKDGTRLWRHMSQELVSSICPVPTAGVVYLAVPGATPACVRAISASEGETLADVLSDSYHRVHHPRALSAYLNRDQPSLVVMSITGKVTVHPVLL